MRLAICSLVLAPLVAAAGCAPRLVVLGAEQGRDRSSGIAQAHGVTLVATADSSRFDGDVTTTATPIYVFLLNDGPAPLEVRTRSFELVDGSGRVHPALRPADLLRLLYGAFAPGVAAGQGGRAGQGEGTRQPSTPPEPLAAESAEPTITPGPSGWIGPGASPGMGPYAPWGYWGFWPYPYAPMDLPYLSARQVVGLGLRPMALAHGNRGEGFVYFERLPKARRLTLRFEAAPVGKPPFPLEIRYQVE
ncbi:MAG: hypothetical protein ACYCWW_09765 [Deltaproteobacteria bacterium]